MGDLQAMDSFRPAALWTLPEYLSKIVTPLHWQEWDKLLRQYPDQQFRDYILKGIRSDFRRGLQAPSRFNMPLAEEQPQVILEYLALECCEGRVLGPLDPSKFHFIHRSQFGVVPKSTPGKWRLIVDLSSPERKSVNNGISVPRCSLSYVRVENAIQGVAAMGRGLLMAKIDIRQAYRANPVHPADRDLLGMVWHGELFIGTALPFGLRSPPKIFTAVADAVTWIIRQQGVKFIIHYLDDFLLIGRGVCRGSGYIAADF